MSTLYLDLHSGISGDMFLGALIDLGVDGAGLEKDLKSLGAGGFHLRISRAVRGGIAGVRFDVHLSEDHAAGLPQHHVHSHRHDHAHPHDHDHGHAHPHEHGHGHEQGHEDGSAHGRTFENIRRMIEAGPYSAWVREKAVAVFQRVAQAEGKIHGRAPDQVHFHEVGATDSIVDIVGACLALEVLGRPRVLASSVVEGTGSVKCAHGRLPLPAPATLEILAARGVLLRQCDEPHELVTPTGAALLAEFAESFGPMQGLVASRIGYGLGSRENQTRPNALRAVLCETAAAPEHDWQTDTVSVLETNLDDLSSEILGALVEKALAAGALDVFHTPIQMKKSRPGVLLTILCEGAHADRFSEMLLTETSAFGVRHYQADRRKLKREILSVRTPHGPVEVKLGRLNGRVVQAAPEFESCRAVAAESGVPLKEIYAAALKALPDF